ncbi:MAG: hydrogenase maturation nickel metallochaperone HypA [Myxococcaceae bacterium]
MHEYSIVQSLLDKVEATATANGAINVHALTVRIGESSGVDAVLLKTAWDTFREKTLCAKAELTIERVQVSWECPRCGSPPKPDGPLVCPKCGSPLKLSAGDEIILSHVELEVADHV